MQTTLTRKCCRGKRKRRNKQAPDVKVIIGGESAGRVFAKMVGADAYSKDATEGVRIIKGWVSAP